MKTRTQPGPGSVFIQTLPECTILALYTSLKGLKGQNRTFRPFKVVFYKKNKAEIVRFGLLRLFFIKK